jgi:hypothetical protein
MTHRILLLLSYLFLSVTIAFPQASGSKPDKTTDMPGMQMPTQSKSPASGASDSDPEQGMAAAMHSMESHHMDMGPHMKMSTLRPVKPGDEQRAQEVVAAARKTAEKYQDYKVALKDGYEIFLPNVPQPMYHFTNYRYAFDAAFNFNPEHPTSLLYEKHGADYKLIGVMYTAPKRFTEDQLDERIPLSIAQWHEHVNLCLPPRDQRQQLFQSNPKFGLQGSITTEDECNAAGGRWRPQVFGWMVHMYPFETTQDSIWSVDRQKPQASGDTE